jgi:hypothetical protein
MGGECILRSAEFIKHCILKALHLIFTRYSRSAWGRKPNSNPN